MLRGEERGDALAGGGVALHIQLRAGKDEIRIGRLILQQFVVDGNRLVDLIHLQQQTREFFAVFEVLGRELGQLFEPGALLFEIAQAFIEFDELQAGAEVARIFRGDSSSGFLVPPCGGNADAGG